MNQPSLRTRLVRTDSGPCLLRPEVMVTWVDGGMAPRRLRPGVARIGSAENNDIVLNDDTVSAHHAEVALDPRGMRLRDLDSTNGTFVRQLRVQTVTLEHSCEVLFGSARVRFEVSDKDQRLPMSRATNFGPLLGHSPEMKAAFALLERVARSDSTVLLSGDSGTGKELAAHQLHRQSDRSDGPFMVFDCGAAAPSLIEAQLFGHVKGAFTGAVAERVGIFEEANGGTLVLDELGELPIDLQPKLLRVLESRTVTRVGDSRSRAVDVRVLASTHRDLEQDVKDGRFRADLFYRVAVVVVHLPPLRHRLEEIPRLLAHFGVPDGSLGEEDIRALQRHDWPGNVRELRNFAERYRLLPECGAAPLLASRHGHGPGDSSQDSCELPPVSFYDAKDHWLERFERRYLEAMLDQYSSLAQACRDLGLSRQTCYRLLHKHGLRRN